MANEHQLTDWAARLSQIGDDNPTLASIIQEIKSTQRIQNSYTSSKQVQSIHTSQLASYSAKVLEPTVSNAFINLSKATQSSYIKSIQKQPPLLITNPKGNYMTLNELNFELERNGFKPEEIDNVKVTEAGNILIYCKTIETYKKLLNKTSLYGGEITELETANDDKAIIIKYINYKEAQEVYNSVLKDKGIKTICESDELVEKYIHSGIKIKYKNHKVDKYVSKPRLVMCYQCGQTGHKATNCRNKAKCIRCSSEEHVSKDCPHKDDFKSYACPNCGGQHPATYAGCSYFKEKLQELYKRRENTSRGAIVQSAMYQLNKKPTNFDNSELKKLTEKI
ncbi:unnamed protein product, partial [Brachionus calyciflorus]